MRRQLRVALAGALALGTIGLSWTGGVPGATPTPASAAPASTDVRLPPTHKPHRYDPTGEYLNYADRSDIGHGTNTKLDKHGVVKVRHGSGYVYNPVTIAQYGLQEWSKYVRTDKPGHLHTAVVQAGWLVANQHRAAGTWTYSYDFAVGGMDETMHAPWSSAMAQGQAMSLLTRIASAYPKHPAYLAAARRAYRPLWKDVDDGGLADTFRGHTIYEEYPTKPGSFALNGFQFTLIGLHDLASTGFEVAQTLFDRGFHSMTATLHLYDAGDTTAYHLGYLTKPPRKVWSADRYHRIHVQLLGVLNTIRPNGTVRYWHDRWATYPPMTSGKPVARDDGFANPTAR